MKAFVIGPIGDQLADPGSEARETYEQAVVIYEEIIVEAWTAVGEVREDIKRADGIDRPGEIPEQIVNAILDADVLIADLTGANANVMYELGLRHASAKPSIQIGEVERLPFDVSTIRTLRFRRSASGFIQARNELAEQIRAVAGSAYDLPTASRIFASHLDVVTAAVEMPTTTLASEDVGAPEGIASGDDLEQIDEIPGYLELRADMDDAMPVLNSRLGAIAQTTAEIGRLAEGEARRIQDATSSRHRLVAVNRFADQLDPLARAYDRDSLEFVAKIDVVDAGLGSMFTNLAEQPDLWDGETSASLESLIGLSDAAREAFPGVNGFFESTGNLENASSRLRPRVRLLRAGLQRTLDAFPVIYSWGDRAKELLDSQE